MTSEKFTRWYRISDSPEIRKIRSHGNCFSIRQFQISRLPNPRGPRLAIAITRRAGPSVTRNRIKRKIRELFRKNKEAFGLHDYFFFINRQVQELKEEDWQKISNSIKEWCLRG